MANGGGQNDRQTGGRLEIPPCVLQDIGPLGPLPKNCKHALNHFYQFPPFLGSGPEGADDLCFHI